MTYTDALHYLYAAFPMYQQIGSTAYKANLNNTYLLDEYFGQPHRKFKTIHVAGTNGKGSVSHMLASVLQAAGYKTGLYTSPHLIDFRERIRVNGSPVSKQFVTAFTNTHQAIFEKVQPSFFEMIVFMAFEYFAHEEVDVAIIEVGLGGRLDATNIITPEVSVITNISKDHTQILGNTLPEIAREKAGIIKKGIPVVIGETQKEISGIFENIARKENCKIYFADKQYIIDYKFHEIDGLVNHHVRACPYWNIENISIDLKGMYQKKNIITVFMTLAILDQKGLKIDQNSVINGLKQVVSSTGLQGRWLEVSHNPLTVCDTAHNFDGLNNVMKQILDTPHKRLHMVLGFVADKDVNLIMSILPREANYYLCEPSIPRAKKVTDLQLLFEEHKMQHAAFKHVSEAFLSAQQKAGENDFIYIGGSTFVVADFLVWKKEEKTFLNK
jgi:dihydrofolate synthase/folylpolyglutamate synthase